MAKKSPVAVDAGRPNYSEIEEMFDETVEMCLSRERLGDDAPYWDGVRQALGWVTGAYTEKPEEE